MVLYQQNDAFFNKNALFSIKTLARYRYSHIFAQVIIYKHIKKH